MHSYYLFRSPFVKQLMYNYGISVLFGLAVGRENVCTGVSQAHLNAAACFPGKR